MADQWHEVVSLFRDNLVEHLEGADRTRIRGKVDGVTIVQIGIEGYTPDQVQQSIKATEAMLKKAGITSALILPQGIEFMCLRPIDEPPATEPAETKKATH